MKGRAVSYADRVLRIWSDNKKEGGCGMNSLQIQYFLTTAEQGSFTVAAQKLFVSQPAVSKQIRLLEAEVGFPLFVRNGKTAALSYEGQVLFDYFTQCRFQYGLLKERLAEKERTGNHPIRISYLEGLDTRHFLGKMEEALEETGGNLSLKLSSYPLSDLVKSLYDGTSDAVLMFGSPLSRADLHAKALVEIPRVIFYSESRFGPDVLDPARFRNVDFLLPEDEYTPKLEHVLFGLFLDFDFMPRVKYVPNYITIMDMVERGEGVFVYNRWCRQCREKGFGFLELPSKQTLYLVHKEKEGTAEVMEFFERLHGKFAE